MHHTYRNALIVLAWLGAESGDSRLAFETLSNLGSENDPRDALFHLEQKEHVRRTIENPLLWNAVAALGSRGYWSRGWIVQEISFAAEAIVICGKDTIDWPLLRKAAMSVLQAFEGSPVRPKFPDMFVLLRYMGPMLPRQESGEMEAPVSYLKTLRALKRCNVSDDKDRIYAFLNLPSIEDTMTVPVRYDWDLPICYEEFAFWHISLTGRLDILSYVCAAANESGVRIKYNEIGSWVPRWTQKFHLPFQPLVENEDPQVAIYHASKGTRVQPGSRAHSQNSEDDPVKRSLLLSGCIVDKIKQLGIVMEDEPANEPLEPHCSPIVQWESMLDAFDIDNVYSRRPFDASPVSSLGILQHRHFTDIPYMQDETSADSVASILQSFSLPEDTDPQRLPLLEAFWRTLIADKFQNRQDNIFSRFTRPDMPGRASRNVWLLYQLWRDRAFSLPGLNLIDGFHDKAFSIAARGACMNRRFMITEGGYIGLAPAAANVGDSIALLEVSSDATL